MQNKKELRKFAKEIRQNIDINSISKSILQIFFSSKYFINAKNIALYYPYGTELNIKPILNHDEKNLYLPKINPDLTMTFHKFIDETNLIKDKYGILSPNTEIINPQIIDLWIVPALMVDKQGYRLGYGKGFYDKLFATVNTQALKLTFIPEELVVNELPVDEYDVPVDIAISQHNIYKFY